MPSFLRLHCTATMADYVSSGERCTLHGRTFNSVGSNASLVACVYQSSCVLYVG
ncbi:hypothetical protein XF_0117 [Xylella fastidiosa 9a5c]|uniref:Uncharacterized protein n=1 Tax=Xylella fastidiosa (strain 9a5c) TaxID=160492 RepID=Q9PH29_XYLFA|nr:hypothetical protein XF_0117 [Xylella fastidiosa 9a5c]